MKAKPEDLIGKQKDEVEQLLKDKGTDYRIVREDDKSYTVTTDYVMSRCNLEVEDGVVIDAYFG